MRKLDKENAIVVCTIVLCFMVTLGLCYFFSGNAFLSVFANSTDECTVYAIATGGYSDLTLARSSADIVKQRGGAGFVQKNGESYDIIYAVYKDETQAQSVLSTLGEASAFIKKIAIEKGNLKWCDKTIKSAVVDGLQYFNIAFETLYNMANELNNKSIAQVDAKTQIRVLSAQIDELKSNFYQQTVNYNNDEITQIKLAIVTAGALLENINTSGTLANCVSSIRYQLVQLVLLRQTLMRNI